MSNRKYTCRVIEKRRRGIKPGGADAYRYLTGEAEVGGGAAFLACGGAHAAVGAAGRVLPFPPLGGRLSGGLSFGATSKEKQRQCQEHNAYRWRQGVLCVCVWESVSQVRGTDRYYMKRRTDIPVHMHACIESTHIHTHTHTHAHTHSHTDRLQRQKQLVYNNPCFVFFRGEGGDFFSPFS